MTLDPLMRVAPLMRDIALDCERGEKLLHGLGPKLRRVVQSVEANIAAHPAEVALFGAAAVVSCAYPAPYLVEQTPGLRRVGRNGVGLGGDEVHGGVP